MFQWPYPIQNAPQAPWQQLPHHQQGTPVFWPPQMFGWQAATPVPGATSTTTQNLVPNMYYSVGYTFPSFSGMHATSDLHMTCIYFKIYEYILVPILPNIMEVGVVSYIVPTFQIEYVSSV